jgi:hypothetical protein
MSSKKYLFGWSNIKKFIIEFIKIYSDRKSFFSKKRIESSVAFIIGQWGMIYFLVKNIENMSSTDITIWASVEFFIAGYIIHAIEKEKKAKQEDTSHTEENN